MKQNPSATEWLLILLGVAGAGYALFRLSPQMQERFFDAAKTKEDCEAMGGEWVELFMAMGPDGRAPANRFRCEPRRPPMASADLR